MVSHVDFSDLIKDSIDVHCHGVSRFDFTELSEIDLQEIESVLSAKGHKAILTLYITPAEYNNFFLLLEKFHLGREKNLYPHIVGFGLEGPMLASHGGTPLETIWTPTKEQWSHLAQCGKLGLIYIVFSPDVDHDPHIEVDLDTPVTDVVWIAETLLEGGVLPAAGHFLKDDPEVSAKALQSIYDVVAAWGKGATITDHLYNDMPHNFKHAWRTKEDKERREQDLQLLHLDSWNLDNLEQKLGPVPATIIRNARKGLVKISQNFDGEHVDLEVVKKTVELAGAENMLMMTDSVECKRLAGQELLMRPDCTLLYQNEGIVAAGTQGVDKQIQNMLTIGLTTEQIKLITRTVPEKVLSDREKYLREKN